MVKDLLENPAQNDTERRAIRLTRYAVREEVSRLLFWLFLGAMIISGLFRLFQ